MKNTLIQNLDFPASSSRPLSYFKNPSSHLNKKERINLGSFYTPKILVDEVYKMLERSVGRLGDFSILDSACGGGDFFTRKLKYIGADIDELALKKTAKNADKNIKLIHTNSLLNVSREKFQIAKNEKLIIIGNPPYNDKTSMISQKLKENFSCDEELKSRDLGLSFLRSFALLDPDFICVLHPLSYLIKRANFSSLKFFKDKYILRDSLIISSQFFTPKSSCFFPIIIALYERGSMDYDFIKNYIFSTFEGQTLCLNELDSIANYVSKYPKKISQIKEPVAFFHALRDINALRRNATFLTKQNANAIAVSREDLKYYIYIHFFKKYAPALPYFLGNCDVFIDKENFLKIEDEFLNYLDKKPFDEGKIEKYFKRLFGKFYDRNKKIL